MCTNSSTQTQPNTERKPSRAARVPCHDCSTWNSSRARALLARSEGLHALDGNEATQACLTGACGIRSTILLISLCLRWLCVPQQPKPHTVLEGSPLPPPRGAAEHVAPTGSWSPERPKLPGP